MRIAIGGISHETNTFARGLTTIDDFRRSGGFPGLLEGRQVIEQLRGKNIDTGGFIEASERLGFTPVPLLWTFAQPSGIVEQAAFDELLGILLDRLRLAMPVDGVLLDLHGAMVTEELEDAEEAILDGVRSVVGPSIPVVCTLDLHANITPAMAGVATALVGYDTYPHVDCAERGLEAAQIVLDAARGEIVPTTGYAEVDMLISPPKQCTLVSPMMECFELVREMERRPGILDVTLAGGFPFADIHHAGVSVVVNADNDARLAQETADELARYVWDRREEFRLTLTPVRQAIREALALNEGPVILPDGSDNPGGGAPCDGTALLRALVEMDAPRSTLAIIVDPESVARAIAAGVGNRVKLRLGGKTDDMHGEPLDLEGYVRLISDGAYVNRGPMMTNMPVNLGRLVVFVVGDVEVLICERRAQPFDMQCLRSVGIEPTDRLIIGLKSAVHFRADYQRVARKIIEIDTPGIHNPDVTRYSYRRLRRPIWPLDEI
ncbi:MAG: M81 family metallopeptidase [Armatimonadetes bacterium]|jgi:microcystin degradation protein MlrC|nr:M81 family metallopeptidase [Armatimonadota bacterium]MDI9585457.1 M81 family metallopeptidase [Acidobacteriota bacterium]